MLILSKKAGLTNLSLLMGVILNLLWLPLASAGTDCTIQFDIPQAECERQMHRVNGKELPVLMDVLQALSGLTKSWLEDFPI